VNDVFISYAREDTAFAKELVAELERHGCDAWIDESDIPPSVPWMNEIQRAIAESMLIVVVDSPAWQGSGPCRIEQDLAEQARVPLVRVDAVGGRVAESVAEIVAAHRALPPSRAVALEAASAAAIWSEAGRRRSLLARGRPLAAMRKARATAPDEFSETATVFLRASRQASLRRWAVGATLALVAPLLAATIAISFAMIDAVNARAAQSVAEATVYAERDTYAQWNIYAALERSPSRAVTSFTAYVQLFTFLTHRTPSAWDPTPVDTAGPTTAVSPDGSLSAVAEGPTVVVTDAAGQQRRLPASAEITSLAWSPNGLWIAASTASGADVISVRNARSIALHGGPGGSEAARAVSWLDDTRVTVGGVAGTGTWHVFDGELIATLDEVRYGATVGTTLYTVNAAGTVTATPTESTAAGVVVGGAVPAGSSPSAMDAAGPLVAVAYLGPTPFLRVVDTASGAIADHSLGDCSPLALSLSPDAGAAYLACMDPQVNLTRVDLATGALTSESMYGQPAYGVRALDDRVLWGRMVGAVFRTDLALQSPTILTTAAGCGAPVRKFVGAADADTLFVIGDGTGGFACATNIETASAEVHRMIFGAGDGIAVPDAATSPDGTLVAYGISDGRVRVFNTDDYAPVYAAQVMADQIRDVAFSPDGSTLIVAGATGEIVTIPIPYGSMAEGAAGLLDDAIARLTQAIEWGIHTPTMAAE